MENQHADSSQAQLWQGLYLIVVYIVFTLVINQMVTIERLHPKIELALFAIVGTLTGLGIYHLLRNQSKQLKIIVLALIGAVAAGSYAMEIW